MSDSGLMLRVSTVEAVADDVVALDLVPVAPIDLPPWDPGAHISMAVPGGRRQYSLCGPVEAPFYLVAVHRSPTSRGGSAYVHDELRMGSVIDCSAPVNRFPLIPGPDYLFVAGGIGITPILPMVRSLDAQGASWRLVYGGRSLASMAFRDELACYGDRVELIPQDVHGLIDLDRTLAQAADQLVYCCGPEALLCALQDHPHCPGGDRFRFERFAASAGVPDTTVDTQFDVRCRRSGVTVTVGAGQSMLVALQAAGFEVDSDCEEGVCGTCELTYTAGTPDHRDDTLLDAERSSLILPCVSRATGTLTVDL